MDTFVDSSWYFLRYCSPAFEHGPFEVEAVRRWCPVDLYVGGVEHAILHLLYSRFFVKVLHDMRMLDFTEPFTALVNQGQVINQGKAMSKSLGNGVDLGAAAGRARRGRDPADDDLRQPARGRHRLGRHERPEALVKFLGRVARVAADVAAAGAAPGACATASAAATSGAAQGHTSDDRRGHQAGRVAPG